MKISFLCSALIASIFALSPLTAHGESKPVLNLTGEVYFSGSPEFYARAQGYQAAGDYNGNQPFAIVYPRNEQDIKNAIQFCIEKKVLCRPRGGGHSYEAYSSLVRNGVIIDMKHFNKIEFSDFAGEKNGVMTAGAGNLMWELYEAMGEARRNVPLATGPTVGIAGLVTAGGVGITSRKYGTTCEHVLSMRMITGLAQTLEISRASHPELFSALCGGGGGNAAIITEIKFKTHPIGKTVAFEIQYAWEDFVKVVDTYQKFVPHSDYGLTGVLALVTGDGFGSKPLLKFYGQYTPDFGDEQDLNERFENIINPMLALPVKKKKVYQFSPLHANRAVLGFIPFFPGSWGVKHYRKNQLYKSTSSYQKMDHHISLEMLQKLKIEMEKHPALHAKPSQPSMIQLLSGGLRPEYRALPYKDGEIRAPSEDLRRIAALVWQFDGYWTDVENDQEPVRKWVSSLKALMKNDTTGNYMGYMDADISDFLGNAVGKEWATKMSKLALQYDPNKIFKDPQGWHAYGETQGLTCSAIFGN